MKNFTRVLLLAAMGLSLFLALSCSKDDTPTTPDFEEFAPYVWDYKNVLWFDLYYEDAKLGPAEVSVSLTARGEDVITSLKVNGQPVDFEYVDSYTEGKYYYGATIEVNTTQPVTYEIDNDGSKYTGNMELPDEIEGNFPDFVATNNYAPSWVYPGSDDPDFQIVQSYASGEAQEKEYTRQIDGDERDYTLLSTFWSDLSPISEFAFDIQAIVYKMKNSNKVLTVGVSNDGYWWSDMDKQPPSRVAKKAAILEMIHKDNN